MSPCVYCGSPWPDETLDIFHEADCPFVTNLWPVLLSDIGEHGFCCSGCGDEFTVNDFYILVPHTDDAGHTHDETSEITCISCAAVTVWDFQ